MPLNTTNKFAVKKRGATETGHVPRISVIIVNSRLRTSIIILAFVSSAYSVRTCLIGV